MMFILKIAAHCPRVGTTINHMVNKENVTIKRELKVRVGVIFRSRQVFYDKSYNKANHTNLDFHIEHICIPSHLVTSY